MLEENPVDLILMDCRMPVMDGHQTTMAIREGWVPDCRKTPIIALTANASSQDQEQCLKVGMQACLPKPYTLEQLYTLLRQWLPAAASSATPARPSSAHALQSDDPSMLHPQALHELQNLSPDQGLLTRVFQAFLDSAPPLVQKIDEALTAGDPEALRNASHALKSSSGNVGARRLSETCRQLEACARENRLCDTDTLSKEFRHISRATLDEIRKRIKAGI